MVPSAREGQNDEVVDYEALAKETLDLAHILARDAKATPIFCDHSRWQEAEAIIERVRARCLRTIDAHNAASKSAHDSGISEFRVEEASDILALLSPPVGTQEKEN